MAAIMKENLLVITPIKHINGVYEQLNKHFKIYYYPDFNEKDIDQLTIKEFYAIYTNPNKSKVRIDKKIIGKISGLKYIVTASTGTNHIDKKLLRKSKIKLISLTKDLKTIRTISSTAEHAFALTLNAIRNIDCASKSVLNGDWDYLPYVGRQMNKLNILIIGFGRLGKMYHKYAKAFGSSIKVCDPFVQQNTKNKNICFVDLLDGVKDADIITLHVHHTKETEKMINKKLLKHCKDSVTIINTSRGEIVNENDIIAFLNKNSSSKYYTDVISDEIRSKSKNILLKENIKNTNIFITPHIGGMTLDAQEIAFGRVANKLISTIKK
jgi:D-3-phosphoglycerate dehydrogenase